MGAGSWVQMNARDLADLAEPVLPAGFHWRGLDGVRHTWPYRDDLHILIEAADGTLVASAIIWIDEQNRTAEFEQARSASQVAPRRASCQEPRQVRSPARISASAGSAATWPPGSAATWPAGSESSR
jgi:hypothetical protein